MEDKQSGVPADWLEQVEAARTQFEQQRLLATCIILPQAWGENGGLAEMVRLADVLDFDEPGNKCFFLNAEILFGKVTEPVAGGPFPKASSLSKAAV